MQRIITIIGPESTGKSELTRFLVEKLEGVAVWEYARTYLEKIDGAYTESDVWKIAQKQWELEQSTIKNNPNNDIIIDTNMEVMKVWCESAFGRCPEFILRNIAATKTDIYLLTDIDMPWEADALREHPHPAQRQYFFNIYKDIVIHSGVPFGIVRGIGAARFENALQIIENFKNQ